MKTILFAIALSAVVPSAMARPQDPHFTNQGQCKAFYKKLENDAIKRLDAYQQQLGLGMPMVVYNDKLSRIQARYHANLKRCDALTRS